MSYERGLGLGFLLLLLFIITTVSCASFNPADGGLDQTFFWNYFIYKRQRRGNADAGLASRLFSHRGFGCLLALGKYTGHFPTSLPRFPLIKSCIDFLCAANEPTEKHGNSLPVINTPGSGDGTKISKPQARSSRPTTTPTKGEASTAQAYGGTNTQASAKSQALLALSSPARPRRLSTDVCQHGSQLTRSKKEMPDAKTTGKLGVALASDGHIHRQLPSETETPENAGRGEQGHSSGAFGFRPQEVEGREQGLSGGSRWPWGRGQVLGPCSVAFFAELS